LNGAIQTIFVVDDDDSVRTSLVRLLKSAGHAVMAFASAEDFLRLVQADEPGCIVVDVHMSAMSGIELLQVLLAQQRVIPAIVITAYEDAETRRAATDAGVVAFLKKPFDDSLLLEAVSRALDRNRQ
jgi:two-component system, LuxR family, response regulator FixJ